MNRRLSRTPFVLLIIALAFGMTGSPTSLSAQDGIDESWLPAPTGPYQVGTTTYHWVDDTRDEVFTDDPGDKRELVVRIWYPADTQEDATPIPYFPNGEADLRGFRVSHKRDNVVGRTPVADFALAPAHSYADAPVSNAEARFPVVVNTTEPFLSIARNQDLASRGYVVVSAYMPHVWAWTVFPDDRTVITDMFSQRWLESARLRLDVATQDQSFVLDQLEMLNESSGEEDRFGGRLALHQAGVVGTSWAAQVAMMAGLNDSRFKAVAAIVSHDASPQTVRDEGMDLPIMFLDVEGEPSDRTIQVMRGPVYQLTFNGMTGWNMGDFGVWPQMPLEFRTNALGQVDSARAIYIVNDYLLAFFDQYLRGEDAPLLDGPSPDYPEVEMMNHNM